MMPNIPDRMTRETQLQVALTAALLRQQRRVLAAAEDREPMADFQRDLTNALAPALASVFLRAADQTVRSASDDLPPTSQRPSGFSFFTDARTWAAAALALLIPALIATTLERLRTARRAARLDLQDMADELVGVDADTRREVQRRLLLDRLESVFGTGRAETIAVTEITRATVDGEKQAIQRIGQFTRVVPVATWRTQRDERVCPICGPLDGLHEREWRDDFPKGPASTHPRCRCEVIYRFFPADAPEAIDAVFGLANVAPILN